MACYARCWMTASECIFDLRSLETALKLIGMSKCGNKCTYCSLTDGWNSDTSSKHKTWRMIWTPLWTRPRWFPQLGKRYLPEIFGVQMLLTYDTDCSFPHSFLVISSFAMWADEGWWQTTFSASKNPAVCRSVFEILCSCCVLYKRADEDIGVCMH